MTGADFIYTKVPFVVTMVVTLLVTSYMLFDPAKWLYNLMELTPMDTDFRFVILGLGIANFAVAYFGERFVFPRAAKGIALLKKAAGPGMKKKRKAYKEILDAGRV